MKTLILATVLLSLQLANANTQNAEIDAVKQFDKEKYLGKWHEVARLPNFFQKQCVKNIQAEYIEKNGGIKVINQCTKKGNINDTAIGFATFENDIGSKLKVSFLPEYIRWLPFTKGDYWVLRIDPDYQVSLVGDPEREYLWVLARDPKIAPEIIQDYLGTAKDFGYDNLNEIIYTQND